MAERPAGRVLETGVAWLDEAALPRAGLVEVVAARPGCGAATLCREILAAAAARRQLLALVDAKDGFDPGSCSEDELAALLWVRCGAVGEALKATDLLLRDGNVPLVLLDLAGVPVVDLRSTTAAHWFRLGSVAEESGAAALVLTPRTVGPAARVRLRLEGEPGWEKQDADPWLAAPRWRVRVEQRRGTIEAGEVVAFAG